MIFLNFIILIHHRETNCIDYSEICDGLDSCPLRDDESPSLCTGKINTREICETFFSGNKQVAKKNIFCSFSDDFNNFYKDNNIIFHFTLDNVSLSPLIPILKRGSIRMISDSSEMTMGNHKLSQPVTITQVPTSLPLSHCHGGIPIYLKNDFKCLCPPTFYGLRCEYQNQRVSVTLRIGAPKWRTPFALVAYLYDSTHHVIDSYHHIRYLSIRDCTTKFNFHLLYSSRPKPIDRMYSIRIHAFEMTTLTYRSSWSFPILFSFLPVYRLSAELMIPFDSSSSYIRCPIDCSSTHGKCATFANSGQLFCRCDPGWSGPTCTTELECNCSPDSICIGISNNRSICVCPVYKFGQRCYLSNNSCEQSEGKKCFNSSQCIPRDHRITTDPPTICSCPDGFHGTRCELNETRIDISISVPNLHEFLLLHFITVRSYAGIFSSSLGSQWGPHERATTFRRIPVDRDSISLYWIDLFHLIFAEYDGNMYLLLIQYKQILLDSYSVSIEPNKRCPPIQELLNDTIVNFPLLRRVKYYHVPCQERIDLPCFHDNDQYLCLCTYDRRANCLTFDHYMRFNCSGLSYCENGGQCFQNTEKCPTAAVCACPRCFLGTRCHLSTRNFGLSVDVILGYQIRLEQSFIDQPYSIKISGIVTIIMLIIGIVNGVLSIRTFKQKVLRQMGCGIYLFTASIMSILTITIFALKYFFLIAIQLSWITNMTFLKGHCISIDFLLKVFLQTGDWLNACVALERLMTTILGIKLNKKLTKKVAIWIVLLVCLFVIGSTIQEPLYRALIKDEEEGRIWCIVRYLEPSAVFLNKYTTIISVVHFIGPFIINIISSFGIIAIIASKRRKTEEKLNCNALFHRQLQIHKNLIISPLVLIFLALPRIIFAFTLDCMKSARDPVTLYLIGYFISFVPPMLIFIVFVLPSGTYVKEFKKSIGIE